MICLTATGCGSKSGRSVKLTFHFILVDNVKGFTCTLSWRHGLCRDKFRNIAPNISASEGIVLSCLQYGANRMEPSSRNESDIAKTYCLLYKHSEIRTVVSRVLGNYLEDKLTSRSG